MLTRYILHLTSTDYVLTPEDLKNWDEIRVSYSRSSADAVKRTYSSEFVFTNTARNLLLETYLKGRFQAQALIELQVIDNNWNWEKVFTCPLDFSTLTYDRATLSINALDNSLAAMIKANKSTKYEMLVGTDIDKGGVLAFDRIPMFETAAYEFTQGESQDDGSILVTFNLLGKPYIGNVGQDISVGGFVHPSDDQTSDTDSYVLKAYKDVEITLDWDISWRADLLNEKYVLLYLRHRQEGEDDGENYGSSQLIALSACIKVGEYSSSVEFPIPSEHYKWPFHYYLICNGIVWESVLISGTHFWENTGKTYEEYINMQSKGQIVVTLKAGEELIIKSVVDYPESNSLHGIERYSEEVLITHSEFKFTWLSIGDEADIDLISPHELLERMLYRITEGKINAVAEISESDSRLADTWMMAAESARGLEESKIYSSFNEFTDWMETVFGYIYITEEEKESRFTKTAVAGEAIAGNAGPKASEKLTYHGDIDPARIVYYEQEGRFFYSPANTPLLYFRWDGWESYNSEATGLAREDTMFYFKGTDNLSYVLPSQGLPAKVRRYNGTEETMLNPWQKIRFIHRSELYGSASKKNIAGISDVKYSVDSSLIYSTVTAGYDKKDYNSVNGRDEYNFNNTYSTGCTISDKSLQLKTKYRADSYGVEFAVQKRILENTDSNSDNDVFFIHCNPNPRFDGKLTVDRSISIEGALNDRLFNGAFSPMACIEANKGLICLQSESIDLAFASSEGNTSVIIDGTPMNGALHISSGMLTNGILEFRCAETDDIADVNELVVVSDGEREYRGYIKDVDIKYAKAEEVTYKLIVKDIT